MADNNYFFVMQMVYVFVLCASCVGSQCCILHDLQFVNTRGDHMEEVYSRASLMTALYVVMSVSYCLLHSVAVGVFKNL